MIKILKLPLSIIKYKLNKLKGEKKIIAKPNENEKNFLNKLNYNGYCIIENFYSIEECNNLIKIIEDILSKGSSNILEDNTKSDQRIFFSEKISKKINIYFKNELIKKLGEYYTKFEIKPAFTLANKVTFKKNNLGSGGGWHKDAYYPQFKSILYLNDVNSKNGPFELLDQSNKLIKSLIISMKLKKGYPNTRFSDHELKILNKEKKITLTGKAGTLILFDGSLIHRGKPVLEGKRYALTNYYFPGVDYNNLVKKFKSTLNND